MRLFGNAIQNYYGTLAISTPGGGSLSINTAGNVTVGAPSSGAALTVNGAPLTGYLPTMQITAPNTTNESNGLAIKAGTSINDSPLAITSAAGTYNYYALLGDGSWTYQRSGGAYTLTMSPSGNVNIYAPSSGTALTVAGANATNTSAFIVSSSAGATTVSEDMQVTRTGSTINTVAQGPNIALYDGTYTSLIQSAGGQMEFWQYIGGWGQSAFFDTNRNLNMNGGLKLGSPTGGNKGPGTVNATALYVNGTAVGGGVTQTTGSFTGTLTGCTTSPTATFNYCIVGNIAFLYNTSTLQATSNTSVCTITGMPAALTPAGSPTVAIPVASNGIQNAGCALPSGTTLTLGATFGAAGSFATSGAKGIYVGTVISYPLN